MNTTLSNNLNIAVSCAVVAIAIGTYSFLDRPTPAAEASPQTAQTTPLPSTLSPSTEKTTWWKMIGNDNTAYCKDNDVGYSGYGIMKTGSPAEDFEARKSAALTNPEIIEKTFPGTNVTTVLVSSRNRNTFYFRSKEECQAAVDMMNKNIAAEQAIKDKKKADEAHKLDKYR